MTPIYRCATHGDIPALIALVTSAYRGDASRQGWTTEADLLDGQRIDADMLRADLDAPGSVILIAEDAGREDDATGHPIGCARIAVVAADDGVATAEFGMFSIRPDLQGGGLGRMLLAEAERVARDDLGCARMRMTVIDCRDELLAWYERRGYVRTGVFKPFPYDDQRYGIPRRAGLRFEVLDKTLDASPMETAA